ncbi:hypothetical protein BH10BAC4_BH10BAC4_08700 [soil metagenome]
MLSQAPKRGHANGTVFTNVNANASIITPQDLAKVTALADAFRPYKFSSLFDGTIQARIETGGLKTADPLDPYM